MTKLGEENDKKAKIK